MKLGNLAEPVAALVHSGHAGIAVVHAAIAAALIAISATDARPQVQSVTFAHASQLRDMRLEPGAAVFGIVVGDEPRAYAIADLEHSPSVVHDIVAGTSIDVEYSANAARVVHSSAPVREASTTDWSAWSRSHADTSLWRAPAVPEPLATRSAADLRITESRHYRTAVSCAFVQSRMTAANPEPPGLLVISGKIENVAAVPVDHVVLRFELLDADGKVVYRDEGFNRSAEALAAPTPPRDGEVVPIAAGATDSFRMILLSEELPAFERSRVSVARVY